MAIFNADAPSYGRHRVAMLVAFLACLGVEASGAQEGQEPQEPQPAAESPALEVLFKDFSYDGPTGRTEVTEPRISQGELSLAADEGVYLEAEREDGVTEWRLEGSVEIRGPGVLVTGDAAEFITRNDVLQRFTLRGDPARFEDLDPGSAGQAFGEAEEMLYDAVDGVVSLNGEARLVLGPNEYIGCDLVYDINAKTSRSGSSECERPRQMIRIAPSEDAARRQDP